MALYIDADLINDETAVAEAVLAGIADRIDAAFDLAEDEGWEAQEGSPETSLAEAVGIVTATAASLVQDTERNDYAGFGTNILGVFRTVAEPAVGYSRWTFSQPGTYQIPDGSELTMVTADGSPVAYATVGDNTVTDGTVADGVQVIALEPGVNANGLLGPATDWEGIPFLAAVEMTVAPTGGTDDESLDVYLDEVVRQTRRLSKVPTVTDDYANAALNVPGVARAVAVRLLDLDNPTDPPDSSGFVTIFVADVAGVEPPAAIEDAVAAEMQGDDRPLGVTVHVGGPTYTPLTLAVSLRLAPDADPDVTTEAVQAAVAAAYDPGSYGLDETAPGRWRPPLSDEDRTITMFDVAAIIDDVEGVGRIDSVTVNGGTDVALEGWAPLPQLTAPIAVTIL